MIILYFLWTQILTETFCAKLVWFGESALKKLQMLLLVAFLPLKSISEKHSEKMLAFDLVLEMLERDLLRKTNSVHLLQQQQSTSRCLSLAAALFQMLQCNYAPSCGVHTWEEGVKEESPKINFEKFHLFWQNLSFFAKLHLHICRNSTLDVDPCSLLENQFGEEGLLKRGDCDVTGASSDTLSPNPPTWTFCKKSLWKYKMWN